MAFTASYGGVDGEWCDGKVRDKGPFIFITGRAVV
ncbi:hypothetical protein EYZ11_000085 [Aspergillus tanneri]|uniref:Uncharacterized protein n=1 Tax=Aspergillus tanneri TaxID=1220188 RepID=A0A4V3UQV7_9EURO|nr:hypothetical protein EYZ11_000085 [Aspergillus tanneri]